MKYLLDTCVISEMIKQRPSKQVAMIWGKIQGKTERVGKSMPAIESLIAATGITHHLTVVTRNTSDMKESGVVLLRIASIISLHFVFGIPNVFRGLRKRLCKVIFESTLSP